MDYTDIEVEHRGHVSWLWLNRPDQMNAMRTNTMVELKHAFETLGAREETRVIMFSGRGRGFCAGADLKSDGATEGDATPIMRFLVAATDMETSLYAVQKPIVAVVNGICMAGGLEMALMCDFIVASKTARIGDGHLNFGAMPGGGSSVRLPRIVGSGVAKFLMYSGRTLRAEALVPLGLVAEVYEPEEMEAGAQKLAEEIAAKSPLGLRTVKGLIDGGADQPLPQALKTEKLAAGQYLTSYDAAEGARAFAEKRAPEFQGR